MLQLQSAFAEKTLAKMVTEQSSGRFSALLAKTCQSTKLFEQYGSDKVYAQTKKAPLPANCNARCSTGTHIGKEDSSA